MARRRPADDDDDDTPRRRAPVDDDDDDDDGAPPKPGENAYTGMLVVTLLALIGACVLFYLHTDALSAQTVPQPPAVNTPLGGAAPAGTNPQG